MSNELQKARKAAIINRVLRYGICLGIPIIVVAAVLATYEEINGANIIAAIAAVAISFGVMSVLWASIAKNKAYAEFITLYKKEMIENAVRGSQLYEQMEFDYNSGMNPDVVRSTGVFTVNRYFSNCYMSGIHNNVSFFQADIRNVRGERGGYSLEYEGTMIVIPTKVPDMTQTNIYKKGNGCSFILPGRQFKTQNQEFNQVFEVYSDNQARAQEVLTNEFTSRLLGIQNQMKRDLILTVKNGRMYIFMTDKKSALKPKLFGQIDDSSRMEVIKELSAAKLFIDAFSI